MVQCTVNKLLNRVYNCKTNCDLHHNFSSWCRCCLQICDLARLRGRCFIFRLNHLNSEFAIVQFCHHFRLDRCVFLFVLLLFLHFTLCMDCIMCAACVCGLKSHHWQNMLLLYLPCLPAAFHLYAKNASQFIILSIHGAYLRTHTDRDSFSICLIRGEYVVVAVVFVRRAINNKHMWNWRFHNHTFATSQLQFGWCFIFFLLGSNSVSREKSARKQSRPQAKTK